MKTWKKIIAFTTITGVALGALAYFAKKKSLEDDFSEDFDDTFDSFDDEISNDKKETEDAKDRNYVPIDLETPSETAASKDDNTKESEAPKAADSDIPADSKEENSKIPVTES